MSFALPEWLGCLRGSFLVFDGPDGSGKSTQFRRLAGLAHAAGIAVCEVREPGGTHLGEEVRKLLLDHRHAEKADIDVTCEMLLFMASRAQLVTERIMPAIERGELVLADRFISSTLAYQGHAGGMPIDDIIQVAKVALKGCWPDITLIFDVDETTAEARMNPLLRGQEFNKAKDRIESKGNAYHRKVREGYLEQARRDPKRHVVLDATQEPDVIFTEMVSQLGNHFCR